MEFILFKDRKGEYEEGGGRRGGGGGRREKEEEDKEEERGGERGGGGGGGAGGKERGDNIEFYKCKKKEWSRKIYFRKIMT